MTTATKTKRSKRRTLSDFPSVTAAERKLSELSDQFAKSEREYRDLTERPKATATSDAERLLAGEDLDNQRLDETVRQANRRRRALRVAIQQQRQTVRSAKLNAARELLDERRGEYEAIVEAITQAVPKLADLLNAEQEWRRQQMAELEVDAFHFEIAPTNPLLTGIAEWQRQAADAGLIDEDSVVDIDDQRIQTW